MHTTWTTPRATGFSTDFTPVTPQQTVCWGLDAQNTTYSSALGNVSYTFGGGRTTVIPATGGMSASLASLKSLHTISSRTKMRSQLII